MFSENYLSCFSTIHTPSKVNIHEYEINPRRPLYSLHCFFTCIHIYYVISVLLERLFLHHRDNGFIFYKKNCFRIIVYHIRVCHIVSRACCLFGIHKS